VPWARRRSALEEKSVVELLDPKVTHTVISELESLLSILKDAETGQRGLAKDEKYLQPYDDALKRINGAIAHLEQLTSDDPEQQARLTLLEGKISARLDELSWTVILMKTGDRATALEIVRSDKGKALMDDVRNAAAAMQRAERIFCGGARQRAAKAIAEQEERLRKIGPSL
jgi:CHASE3 domain sensor protein